MRQLYRSIKHLSRQDKWLLLTVIVIIIGIVLTILYGVRQSELAEQQDRLFKQQTEAATERNRLELEKQAAESAAQIAELKRLAAEVNYRQSQVELRDVRGQLQATDRARQQELKQYEAKIKGIITSNVSACERWIKNCNDARRLGLRDPDAPCECR